eukprot:363553-Chlamydomonas_euryale.AAC.1
MGRGGGEGQGVHRRGREHGRVSGQGSSGGKWEQWTSGMKGSGMACDAQLSCTFAMKTNLLVAIHTRRQFPCTAAVGRALPPPIPQAVCHTEHTGMATPGWPHQDGRRRGPRLATVRPSNHPSHSAHR